MIYLSEEFMDVERLFREGAFTERAGVYYYVVEEEKEDLYLCVKLSSIDSDLFDIEVVSVSIEFDEERIEENIEAEVDVAMKEERAYALERFFSSLRNVESTEYLKFDESIFELVKEYIDDEAYYFNEGKSIKVEILDIFEFSGEINEGFYGDSLVLTSVEFKNRMTDQVIKEFDDYSLEYMVSFEEGEEIDEILEGFAESISPYDMEKIFKLVAEREEVDPNIVNIFN